MKCVVCGAFTGQDVCCECQEGGVKYQEWRKEIRASLHSLVDSELFVNRYALELFRKKLTPTQAIETAQEAFEQFLDGEYKDYVREERQWAQWRAGDEITKDGYPLPSYE